MRKPILAALAASLLATAPAVAQEGFFSKAGRMLDQAVTETGKAVTEAYAQTKTSVNQWLDTTEGREPASLPANTQLVSDVVGSSVRMPGVEGELAIRDIVVGPDGRASHVIVAAAGVPYINETVILVPADALYELPDGTYAVEMTAAEARALPYLKQ